MTDAPTLQSRLRVLVAKTFRAEKLFSSVQNTNELRRGPSKDPKQQATDLANDIRSREWQESHKELRAALNDIIELGNNKEIVKHIIALRNAFFSRYQKAEFDIEQGTDDLIHAVERHEFAHVIARTSELIKVKAQLQANKAIIDELTAVIDASSRGATTKVPITASIDEAEYAALPKVPQRKEQVVSETEFAGSNVIPLRRAAGSKSRRR